MPDFTRVELSSLSAAKKKLRKLTIEAERKDHDMTHTVYKVGQFLADALPDAWAACEERAPDHAPEEAGGNG